MVNDQNYSLLGLSGKLQVILIFLPTSIRLMGFFFLTPYIQPLGSIRSSISSRKSSTRSCYSTSTVKTSTSTIKKNSGNFDGSNIRKKSLKERKLSLPCNSNKSSVSDQEKFITAFYQNLKKIDDETSSESSFSDEGEKFDAKARAIDLCIHETSNYRRTEEYVLQHANVGNYDNEDEDSIFIDTEEDEGFHPETPKPFTKDEKKSYNKDAAKSKSSTSKKVSKRLSQQSSIFTDHKEIDSKRLNALLFDFNSNFIPNKFDTVPKSKLNRAKSLPPRPRGLHKHVISEASSSDQQKIKKEALNEIQDESDISVSTDSAHGSTRSISTASSDTFSSYNYNSPRASVPMNFIPGFTTPQQGRPRNRSLPVSLTVFRKASFCFKGVTCRIYQNSPRTYRALAHAGCVALIIPAPESHKCKH